MAYDRDELVEREIHDPDEIGELIGKFPVTWIHVSGFGDIDAISKLAGIIGLHLLGLEDVLSMNQRTKVEQYDNHIYAVIRMPIIDDGFHSQQLNIFLGENYVVTFQQYIIGYLNPVRERIRKSSPRERFLKPDYLAYTLLDAAIDNYFPVLETYGEILMELEQEIIGKPAKVILPRIYAVKSDLQEIRRAVWPQRDAINLLLREQTPFITSGTQVYLRDCHDHAIQLMDLTENFREYGSDLVNLYMTSVSNDMNAVMKVLTIIATIFIPLGFIAGLYGMNFNPEISPLNMPELNWYCGYPFALGIMALTAAGLLAYFRWRRWF